MTMISKHVGDYKKCLFKDLKVGDFFILKNDKEGKIFIKMKDVSFSYIREGMYYKSLKNSFCVGEYKLRYQHRSIECYKMGGRIEFLLGIIED
jgi:hypothetical protein